MGASIVQQMTETDVSATSTSEPPAPAAPSAVDANEQLANSLKEIQTEVDADQATGSDEAIFRYVSMAHSLAQPEWREQYERWMQFVAASEANTVLPGWTQSFLSTSITAAMYGCSIIPGVEYASTKCQSIMTERIKRAKEVTPAPPIDLSVAREPPKE